MYTAEFSTYPPLGTRIFAVPLTTSGDSHTPTAAPLMP